MIKVFRGERGYIGEPMTHNILSAINSIDQYHNNNLEKIATKSRIRINSVGDRLEKFVEDSLADCLGVQNSEELHYPKVFSHLGEQNNPPDAIIRDGDAFEIKKIESPKSSIALNSSPPRDYLYSIDSRITERCRQCEKPESWVRKDIFYVIGHVKENSLKHLFFIHGPCYAAKKGLYDRISNPLGDRIKSGILKADLNSGETAELGRVNDVDPLGITSLRVRGIWQIENPLRVFDYMYSINLTYEFSLVALMLRSKYVSFPSIDRRALQRNQSITIENVLVKNPNNPNKRLDGKLIHLGW